jgi:acyl CoA:acetate/3-ketoacid CoA transferase beta subunit
MECTRQEIMAVAAARELKDREVALIGTGLPMIAAYLAKFTHAPGLTLIFESGVVGAQPRGLAIGVGDFRLVSHCQKATSLYYALSLLQAGRIDVGFLGAAEIDAYGNLNTTAIGDYERPRVRLPGSGGANDIASLAKRVILIVMHQRRKFVEQLQYLTTPGYLDGGDARRRAGLVGGGPSRVITDLAVLDFAPGTRRMRLESLHPGVTVEEVRDNTGFELVIPSAVPSTPLPSSAQVRLLRDRIDPDGVYLTPSTTTVRGAR